MLVAICGIDGAGKTTQIEKLKKALNLENDVFTTKQPSDWYRKDSRLRAFLNQEMEESEILLQELALFAASDRLRHIQTEVFPKLEEGDIVITDRYVFSTYAYFLARGINDIEWLKNINRHAPTPDVTIYIDIPIDVAIKRIIERDGESKKREELDVKRMSKVRDVFLKQPWGEVENYYTIDGLKPLEEKADEILKIVTEVKRNKELNIK